RSSSDGFRAAPHDGQDRRAVLRRHAVDATVRPVVHVARGHDARLVRVRAFDEEDQLVTDVTMRRERGPRLEASQQGATLGDLVLPEDLEADSGPKLLPSKIADGDDLRSRTRRRHRPSSFRSTRTWLSLPPPAPARRPVHLAIHRRRGGEVLLGPYTLACAPTCARAGRHARRPRAGVARAHRARGPRAPAGTCSSAEYTLRHADAPDHRDRQ